GTETDVDCGGANCPKCAVGLQCAAATDCLSGVCQNGICQPAGGSSCTDGVKNGTETGLDCGGASCPKCGSGQGCAGGADCLSGVCSSGVCQTATCADGIKNGTETDVDCGGGACTTCGTGKFCGAASDCLSGICSGGTCQAPCGPGLTHCG